MSFFNKKDILVIFAGVIICVLMFFGISSVLNEVIPGKKHEKLLKDIRKSAYKYGLDNIDYFKQGYEMYISVDSLVTNGYLKSNDKTQTLYVDNLTGAPFTGVVYIYYKDDKVHTEYLEEYSESEKDNLIQKNLSISLDKVTSNSISILVNNNDLAINNYEYYINDLKVKDSSNNRYTYSGLFYSAYKIKVVAYSNNQEYEDNIIVSLTQIPLPEFSITNDILTITYPDNVNDYIYKYSFDQVNWTQTLNKVENIDISSNSTIYAEVTDGYNSVMATEEINKFDNKKEEKKSYTVKFDLNGGSGKIKDQVITESSFVIKPITNPSNAGYEFIGWYLDNKLYDFNTPVTSDITLTAKWSLKETKKYKVEFDLNGGAGFISAQLVEENKTATQPYLPLRNGYEFVGWYLNNQKYNFNQSVTANITLKAMWKQTNGTYYTVTFDLNGGTGNITNQSVVSGGSVSRPQNPTKTGYEFIGWYLNNNLYNFSSSVSSNLTLRAQYKIINQNQGSLSSGTVPVLNYNFSSASNGKWVFINNPEALYKDYLTDNSGKALYSDYINGNAEIYYEHYIKLDMKYGIRFYNPTSSNVTLKINKCGSSLVRGNGDIYIDTWKEYYGYSSCSMAGKSFNISPNSSVTMYISAYSTGSGWSDWDSTYVTTVPSKNIPESVIDGVFNVTSSGKLNVESFAFKNANTIPSTSYSSSANYVDTAENRAVYSGYYDKLPFLTADIKFDITDLTPRGALKIKYSQNSAERDSWYTHLSFNESDVFQGDLIKPITQNNSVTNWGNWAVHYTENIIINNTTNSTKSIAYYVNAGYAIEQSGMASALVAFPKNNSLSYTYKRSIIGKWHTDKNFEKVWEINVPANTQITVPTEVLLGGNSAGKLGRKVELLN